MMARALITGGTGRIGRRASAALLAKGYAVRSYDMVAGDLDGVDYIVGDICDADAVAAAMIGVDYVVHLAAIPVENGRPHELFESNVRGTFVVIDAAATHGVRGLIFASTVAAYGLLHPSRPFEPQYFPVDEETPLIPDRNYASMKIVGENFANSYSRAFGMDVVVLRIASVFDPDAPIWDPVLENLDDPEQPFVEGMTMRDFLWQYVHAADVAQALENAVGYLQQCPGFGFEAFNIGAAETLSTVPTMELIRRYFPNVPLLKLPAQFVTHPTASLYSIAKATDVLGYVPQHSWRSARSEDVR